MTGPTRASARSSIPWIGPFALAVLILIAFALPIRSNFVASASFAVVVDLVFLGRGVWLIREPEWRQPFLASSIGSLVSLLAFVGPALQLRSGTRTSQLVELHFLAVRPSDASLAKALFLATLGLIAVAIGEWVCSLQAWSGPRSVSISERSPGAPGLLFWALLALGLVSIGLGYGDTFLTSAVAGSHGSAQGVGFVQLIGWGIPLACGVLIIGRARLPQPLRYLLILLLAAVILLSGNKSSLLLLACIAFTAWNIRRLGRHGRLSFRHMVSICLAVYLGLALLAGLSEWRGDLIHHDSVGLQTIAYNSITGPVTNLAGGELDTLDGALLSADINRQSVDASPADLLPAVLYFIPRSVWPTKPDLLSVRVSRTYLGYGSSGIFLSPQGTFRLVFGSTLLVLVSFGLVGLAIALLERRLRSSPMGAGLLLYFIFGFFSSGSPFDVFHDLAIALLYVSVVKVTDVLAYTADARPPLPA